MGIGDAPTTRRSRGCTRPARPSPAARSARWRRSCAATSSTPSTRAAGSTTRCPTRRRGSASTTTRRWRSRGRARDGLRVLYVDLDVHHGDGVQAIYVRRPGRADAVGPRERAVPVPGDRVRRRAGGGGGRRDVGQRAARAVHGRGGLAGGGPCAGADAGRRVRAGRHRVAARRRLARLGPARAPAGDDDGDGRGGAARRRGRAPLGRRPMAGDGRRRVRRLPGGAAGVGADLAGGRASRGAVATTPAAWRERWEAEAAAVRHARHALDVRGRAERRASGRRRAGGRGGAVARDPGPRPLASCCRG